MLTTEPLNLKQDELKEILEKPTKTNNTHLLTEITEDEFTDTYLPIVLALYNGQKPNVTNWTHRTGGVHLGFKVVDRGGELLFITPGLFVNSSFSIENGFLNLMHELQNAYKLNHSTEHIFAKHLNKDKAKLNIEGGSANHQIAWYQILSRYNYKIKGLPETGRPNTEKPKAETQVSEELNWEDGDEFDDD